MHKYVHTIYLSFFNRTWTVDTDSCQGVAIVHICAVTIKNRKTEKLTKSAPLSLGSALHIKKDSTFFRP
jgi:hypothetical protein